MLERKRAARLHSPAPEIAMDNPTRTVPKRPVLRYHGGKWMLAPWIISHFPNHRIYVEPYGGGASVLLRKLRVYSEVYNDLDGEIVGLFRVLRDVSAAERLIQQLRLTPYSRDEFNGAYTPCDDPVEQARRTIIKSYMGFESAAVTAKGPTLPGAGFKACTGFRANSDHSGTTPAHDWANYPPRLVEAIVRLQGVVIENRAALECMAQHDNAEALHYVDPPYVHSTRKQKQRRTPCSYRHEMSDEQHREMCEFLKTVKGMVVLSGYPNGIYDELGWQCVTRAAHADGAKDRIEALWFNPDITTAKA